MKTLFTTLVLLAAALAAAAVYPQPPARTGADYVYEGDMDFGAPGFWDYITLDDVAGRLYLGHVDHVTVVDAMTARIVGTVGPLAAAHGVAIAPALHKGYATSGGDGLLKVFGLDDLKVRGEIKVGLDADGVLFDPRSNTVIVMIGDGKQVVIVDPVADRVLRTVDLPAGPEFAAADARGKVYVNLESTAQLAKVDIATGHVDAVWQLTGCISPHGIAYDPHTDRLFRGCVNKLLVVVDPGTGKNIATLPIGGFSDGVGVDVARHRVFSPNGDGTLTVIDEGAGDSYRVERTVPTFLGGRSMAVDARTGRLFVTHGDTKIKSPRGNFRELRFGWDNAEVAIFRPND